MPVTLDMDEFTYLFSWLWKFAIAIFILCNFKCLPLAWHIRILRGYRYLLRSNRPKRPVPAQLFQPLIITSGNSLMELDYNLHKSNSTYFADLDIARCHLMCTLFSSGVDYARNARRRVGILGASDDLIGLALGAVSCTFKKEVKPCQRYEIWTRVLTWDEKWMYIVTHFVRKDAVRPRAFTLVMNQKPRQGRLKDLARKEDAIFASALSKCVWKKGRRTVPPEVMLHVSGLLPARPGQEDIVSALRDEPLGRLSLSKQAEEIYDLPFKALEKIEMAWDTLKSHFSFDGEEAEDGIIKGLSDKQGYHVDENWDWERVETERQRGMKIALSLAELDKLHGEFAAEVDALGLRADLW